MATTTAAPSIRILKASRAAGLWYWQCGACGERGGYRYHREAAVENGCAHLIEKHNGGQS